MKMSKLSNQTNSPDPQAVNSRVFVGNLNTFQCSKTDVERMFQKYGRLAGISMHKGYAFVQFSNTFDARNACHGEDGRTILSQILDVNMVAEPKPHQIGRKRQNVSKTGNDWDYYYDSYCTSTMFPTQSPRPVKRQRLMAPLPRGNGLVTGKVNSQQHQHHHHQQQQQQQHQQLQQPQMMLSTSPMANSYATGHNGIGIGAASAGTATATAAAAAMNNGGGGGGGLAQMVVGMMHSVTNNGNGCNGDLTSAMYTTGGTQHHMLGPFKVYSNPDTLVCGNCRECFMDLGELLDHKRSYCKLRFTCKCQENNSLASKSTRAYPTNSPPPPPPPPAQPMPTTGRLLCAVCKEDFTSPWELMVHAQTSHMIHIYELSAADAVHHNNNNNLSSNNNITDKNLTRIEDAERTATTTMTTTADEVAKQLSIGLVDDVELSDTTLLLSPRSSGSKEEDHIFDAMSPNHLSKHESRSTASSRDSSPRPESVSPMRQECIMRTLSIETAPTSSLEIVTSSLALTISSAGSIASQ